MGMKKICSLLVVGLIAGFALIPNAFAANSVRISCAKTQIEIGGSTNCTVYGTVDFTSEENAPSAATITFSHTEYLKISNIQANSTAGWINTTSAAASNSTYSFSNSAAATKITSGKEFEIMSFTATLDQAAKNLASYDDCANLCISAATFNGSSVLAQNIGTCFNPTVTTVSTPEECVGASCNAETGAFLNYSLVIVGSLVAVCAIIVSKKNSKFFRI